jgi:hypothetical protein
MLRGWSPVRVVVGSSDQVAEGVQPAKLPLDNHYRIFGARDRAVFMLSYAARLGSG